MYVAKRNREKYQSAAELRPFYCPVIIDLIFIHQNRSKTICQRLIKLFRDGGGGCCWGRRLQTGALSVVAALEDMMAEREGGE